MRISEYLLDYDYDLTPNSASEIDSAETLLGFKFDSNYVEFLLKFGGCFVGVDVYGVRNSSFLANYNIIDLTNDFKKEDIVKGLICVISLDGSGNSIYMNENFNIMIFDHNNGTEEILYNDFESMIIDCMG